MGRNVSPALRHRLNKAPVGRARRSLARPGAPRRASRGHRPGLPATRGHTRMSETLRNMPCRYEIKLLGEAMWTRFFRCVSWGAWCAALQRCVHAQQNPNGQIPVAGLADAYLVLIRDPLVHKELRLSDQQRRAVAALTDELDRTLWTLRNQTAERAGAGFRNLIAKAEARMEPILSAASEAAGANPPVRGGPASAASRRHRVEAEVVRRPAHADRDRAQGGQRRGDAPRPKTNGKAAAGKSKPRGATAPLGSRRSSRGSNSRPRENFSARR